VNALRQKLIKLDPQDFAKTLGSQVLIYCRNCSCAEFGEAPKACDKYEKFVATSKCRSCTRSVQHRDKFSLQNKMHPITSPPPLPELSSMEEQLIALAQPVVRVVHLRGGQLGYQGSCVAVTQDVASFALRLPRAVQHCGTIFVVKKFESVSGSDVTKKFRIRRTVVTDWLLWLKANNPFYRCVEIDEESLQQLPEDSGVRLDHLECVTVEDDSDFQAGEGFKEMVVAGNWAGREEEALDATLDWPSCSKAAIREFKHPGACVCVCVCVCLRACVRANISCSGLLAKCFPSIFPYGLGDPTTTGRQSTVSLSEGVKYLTNFCYILEGQLKFPFATHPVAP